MNEQTTSTRWWNKKRIIASLLALALIIGTLTAGTFAWNAISQSALNEAKADNIMPGGRLHDDFNGTNKDVYVENYGTLPIYVRVQLSEYMEIGDGAGLKAGDTGYAAKTAQSLMPSANINDPSTWSKISTANTQFTDYWTWTMGGQKAFMPTFDKDKTSLKTDITGLNTFGITSDEYQHNVSDPLHGGTNVFGKDGNHDQYAVGDTETSIATYKDASKNGTETHTAQDTLPGSVITMAQWIADGSNPGPYWVVDTDGWAYWAQAIQPGTASGLLLNGISLNTEMDDNWYYGIFVNSDMASLNDVALLKDGTTDGKNLIDIITQSNQKAAALAYVDVTPPSTPYNAYDTPAITDFTVTCYYDDGSHKPGTVTSISPSTQFVENWGTIPILVNYLDDQGNPGSMTVNVTVNPPGLPLMVTKNGVGPYDTQYSEVDNTKNFALVVNMESTDFNNQTMNQAGSIPLSNIVGSGVSPTGLGVVAVDPLLSTYFSIGTDKAGNPAIIYTYVPDQAVWDAAAPNTPTVNVQLLLTKAGYQDTPITVILRYNCSQYSIN